MLFKRKEKTKLDSEIDQLTLELKNHAVTSKEYGKIVKRMSELHKIRADQAPESLSPNNLLAAGATILGILLVTKYEYENVVTSKAMSFIRFK